ncbi:hypothetical protein CSUI_006867 [Cystoisospora suis]|uniref:Uncharacterized protein n=1 Tax=Cystoisospora suis TaxID=483139 RepID=A0A2C6KSL6_9APIC|nr:hypothetical protein CSUI_006867 [Cystoisospora suis]
MIRREEKRRKKNTGEEEKREGEIKSLRESLGKDEQNVIVTMRLHSKRERRRRSRSTSCLLLFSSFPSSPILRTARSKQPTFSSISSLLPFFTGSSSSFSSLSSSSRCSSLSRLDRSSRLRTLSQWQRAGERSSHRQTHEATRRSVRPSRLSRGIAHPSSSSSVSFPSSSPSSSTSSSLLSFSFSFFFSSSFSRLFRTSPSSFSTVLLSRRSLQHYHAFFSTVNNSSSPLTFLSLHLLQPTSSSSSALSLSSSSPPFPFPPVSLLPSFSAAFSTSFSTKSSLSRTKHAAPEVFMQPSHPLVKAVQKTKEPQLPIHLKKVKSHLKSHRTPYQYHRRESSLWAISASSSSPVHQAYALTRSKPFSPSDSSTSRFLPHLQCMDTSQLVSTAVDIAKHPANCSEENFNAVVKRALQVPSLSHSLSTGCTYTPV